jgi:hypothetical protein
MKRKQKENFKLILEDSMNELSRKPVYIARKSKKKLIKIKWKRLKIQH